MRPSYYSEIIACDTGAPGGLQAPEIVSYQSGLYIAALRPDLKGIQVARLVLE